MRAVAGGLARGSAGLQCLRLQVHYLSQHSAGLVEVLLTGGLPPCISHHAAADDVYFRLFRCATTAGLVCAAMPARIQGLGTLSSNASLPCSCSYSCISQLRFGSQALEHCCSLALSAAGPDLCIRWSAGG